MTPCFEIDCLLSEKVQSGQLGVDEDTKVPLRHVVISLSPLAIVNLWAMALLALSVSVGFIVWCILRRREREENCDERAFAVSDSGCMVETDVYF